MTETRGSSLPEIHVNLVLFVLLCFHGFSGGFTPRTYEAFAGLGLFTLWTETARLEARIHLFFRAPDPGGEPARILDGALGAAILTAVLAPRAGWPDLILLPPALFAGALLAALGRGLSLSAGLMAALMLVYHGRRGLALRGGISLLTISVMLLG